MIKGPFELGSPQGYESSEHKVAIAGSIHSEGVPASLPHSVTHLLKTTCVAPHVVDPYC